ncbi:hypothetical protein FQN50_003977 [Emmonsiellopsis sp. PD_5]|nr:hypothetical protein FQN50_003977 [Emmonsiellopsis sp. PD_5]
MVYKKPTIFSEVEEVDTCNVKLKALYKENAALKAKLVTILSLLKSMQDILRV